MLLKKELKSTDLKRTVVVLLLLTVMLGVIVIGQIGQMEKNKGLEIEGIIPLVSHLLHDKGSFPELAKLLFNIGFGLSIIVYSAYIGLPYALSSYERLKVDGTMHHLMVMPVSIRKTVFKYAMFGFLKTMMMTTCTFFLLSLPFVVINPSVLLIGSQYINLLGLLLISFLSIFIVTSLLWIFNGSKLVLSVYRWSLLGLLIVLMPMVKHIGFAISIPSEVLLGVVLVLLLIAFICLYFVGRYFDKEKVLLSFSK